MDIIGFASLKTIVNRLLELYDSISFGGFSNVNRSKVVYIPLPVNKSDKLKRGLRNQN